MLRPAQEAARYRAKAVSPSMDITGWSTYATTMVNLLSSPGWPAIAAIAAIAHTLYTEYVSFLLLACDS